MDGKLCGKGEIAHYEQFHHFPQYFQKACFPGASKGVIVWEWDGKHCGILREKMLVTKHIFSFQQDFQIKWPFPQGCQNLGKPFSSIYTHFNLLKKKALGKHCGKR